MHATMTIGDTHETKKNTKKPLDDLRKLIDKNPAKNDYQIIFGCSYNKNYFSGTYLQQILDDIKSQKSSDASENENKEKNYAFKTKDYTFLLLFDVELINLKREQGKDWDNASDQDVIDALKNALEYLNKNKEFFKALVKENIKFKILLPLTKNGIDFELLKKVLANYLNEYSSEFAEFKERICLENHSQNISSFIKDYEKRLDDKKIGKTETTCRDFLKSTSDIAKKGLLVKTNEKKAKIEAKDNISKGTSEDIIKKSVLDYLNAEIPLIKYFNDSTGKKAFWGYPFDVGGNASKNLKTILVNLYDENAPQFFNIHLSIPNSGAQNRKKVQNTNSISKTLHPSSPPIAITSSSPKEYVNGNSSPSSSDSEDGQLRLTAPPKNISFLGQTRTSNPNSPTTSPGSTSPQRSPSPDLENKNMLQFLLDHTDLTSNKALNNFHNYLSFLTKNSQKRLSQEIQGETSAPTLTTNPSSP